MKKLFTLFALMSLLTVSAQEGTLEKKLYYEARQSRVMAALRWKIKIREMQAEKAKKLKKKRAKEKVLENHLP